MDAKELKLWLRKYKIRQQDLARYMGISDVYISNLICGKYPVSDRVVKYIEKATPILEKMQKIREKLYIKI